MPPVERAEELGECTPEERFRLYRLARLDQAEVAAYEAGLAKVTAGELVAA